MSVADFKQRAKKYLKKKENNVVDTQKEIVSTAMDMLFTFSPHHPDFDFRNDEIFPGYMATGEYDANHKITSESISESKEILSTGSLPLSAALHNSEKERVHGVSDIGETVTIKNMTNHAHGVEHGYMVGGERHGDSWKNIEAYHTYRKAKNATKSLHGNKLS